MIYSNPEFLLLLLGTFLVYAGVSRPSIRFHVLLASSFFFYAWAGLFDCIIFVFVIIVSWLATWLADRRPGHRRAILGAGIAVMAIHLFFWKYATWVTREIQAVWPGFLDGRKVDLPLPVGISFFTLQGIAYLVDLGRGEASLISFKEYSLFKSFFPQLIAGPIVRVNEMIGQLRALRTPDRADVAAGLQLFALGIFKKLAIADRCGSYVDFVFDQPGSFDRTTLIKAVLGYAVQIWADFSGYTDMGRGAARLLGFRLPENFLSPYFARSPSEFWRRWHITLSQWIRDYIYIPLGGNRGSKARVAGVALLTMLISGFWHGANWNFAVWGLYHGGLLAAERAWRSRKGASRQAPESPAGVFARMSGMFVLTCFGWLIFRSPSYAVFSDVLSGIVRSRVGPDVSPDPVGAVLPCVVLCFVIQAAGYFSLESGRKFFPDFSRRPAWGFVLGALFAGMAVASLYLRPYHYSRPFIYFQF